MKKYIVLTVLIIALVAGYSAGNYLSINKIRLWAHERSMEIDPTQPESAEILELEYPIQQKKTYTRTEAVITSPKDGDSFCYGDWIPIRWSSPISVDHVSLYVVAPANYYSLEHVVGVEDNSGLVMRYSYDWDGMPAKDDFVHPKRFVDEGHFYEIKMELDFKDGSVGTFRSNGKFSIIDCHIKDVKPPVK